MNNITAPSTIGKLRQIFAVHALPDFVVADNGQTFISELFTHILGIYGICHIRTAPFHLASNGLAKRVVPAVKEGLKCR